MLALALTSLAGAGSSDASGAQAQAAAEARTSVAAARAAGTLRPQARHGATTARIVMAVTSRRDPRAHAPPVWRVAPATGWSHAQQVLLVLRAARDARGRRWLKVALPIRPNGSAGWIPADNARLRRTPYWIDVATAARTVRVYRDGRLVRQLRATVGAPGTPTPHGLFAIWEKTPQPPSYAARIGPWALLLTSLSEVLRRFDGGPGRVAFHGGAGGPLGPLGGAASNGCIRLTDGDVTWLAHRVPTGTPVAVHR